MLEALVRADALRKDVFIMCDGLLRRIVEDVMVFDHGSGPYVCVNAEGRLVMFLPDRIVNAWEL